MAKVIKRMTVGVSLSAIVAIMNVSPTWSGGDATSPVRHTHDIAVQNLLSAGPIIAPAEWEGVWDLTITTSDCDGNNPMVTMETDTICAGDPFEVPNDDPNFSITCTGTVDATSVNATCTGAQSILGCNFAYTADMAGTRSGNTYQATTIATIIQSGLCGADTTCFMSVVDAVRSPDEAPPCSTPVEESSWGNVKKTFED